MTNEAADILRKAKELIETKGWTQGELARNEYGEGLEEYDTAVCFCSIGAIDCARVDANRLTLRLSHICGIFEQAIGDSAARWNDEPNRTKEDVLSAFDRAITLAEAGKS